MLASQVFAQRQFSKNRFLELLDRYTQDAVRQKGGYFVLDSCKHVIPSTA
jgi:hypothetical protein